MRLHNSNYLSIEQFQDQYLKQPQKNGSTAETAGISFQEILKSKSVQGAAPQGDLKFSKHAANRLADRKITLSDSQMERLNDGARKAEEKGIKETLVLMDQLAFIVNVPNNTVITAMDQTGTDENIFTNIDGAVII